MGVFQGRVGFLGRDRCVKGKSRVSEFASVMNGTRYSQHLIMALYAIPNLTKISKTYETCVHHTKSSPFLTGAR